jgi:hypothetical protein
MRACVFIMRGIMRGIMREALFIMRGIMRDTFGMVPSSSLLCADYARLRFYYARDYARDYARGLPIMRGIMRVCFAAARLRATVTNNQQRQPTATVARSSNSSNNGN